MTEHPKAPRILYNFKTDAFLHKHARKHRQASGAQSPHYVAPALMVHLTYQNRKMLRHNDLLNISENRFTVAFGG